MVFQLVSRKYERGTMIITSNKSFAEWGGVLGDDVWPPPASTACCITAR
jgi:DNA replication protein DnaC